MALTHWLCLCRRMSVGEWPARSFSPSLQLLRKRHEKWAFFERAHLQISQPRQRPHADPLPCVQQDVQQSVQSQNPHASSGTKTSISILLFILFNVYRCFDIDFKVFVFSIKTNCFFLVKRSVVADPDRLSIKNSPILDNLITIILMKMKSLTTQTTPKLEL